MTNNNLSMLRFAIAIAFLNKCQKVDDRYFYYHSKTKIELDIEAVKLAMKNNIEGAFTEEYGNKDGIKKAKKMYTYMLKNPSNLNDRNNELSDLGDETMNELFKCVIEMFESDMTNLPNSTIH